MSLPYYKRFPRDFLEGTIGLSFEEKGAYAIVLDLIYMRGGRLEDDARYVAGQLGCSVRMWKGLLESLISKGKISIQNGFIVNFRAEKEIENVSKYQDKQAENRSNPNKNNTVKSPKNNHSRDYSEPDSEPEEKDANASQNSLVLVAEPVGQLMTDFAVFWQDYPNKVGKPAAKTAYDRALKRHEPGKPPPTPAMIHAGLARYVLAKPKDRAWLNPATFLNQDRWNDEPASDVQSGSGQGRPIDPYIRAAETFAESRGERLGRFGSG